jgi:hypothetical protein
LLFDAAAIRSANFRYQTQFGPWKKQQTRSFVRASHELLLFDELFSEML